MVSPTSFEGAEGNLIHLFEQNTRRYSELAHSSPQGEMLPEQRRFALNIYFFQRMFVPVQSASDYVPRPISRSLQLCFRNFKCYYFIRHFYFRSKDIKRFIVRFLHLCDVFVTPQQRWRLLIFVSVHNFRISLIFLVRRNVMNVR